MSFGVPGFCCIISAKPGYISGFLSPTLQIKCRFKNKEACAIARSAILNLSKFFVLDSNLSEHNNFKSNTTNPALLATYELFQYNIELLRLFGYHQPDLIKIISINDLAVEYMCQ